MSVEELQERIRDRVGVSMTLRPRGAGEFTIVTPFQFGDGDHYVMHLRALDEGRYEFSDGGYTFMHISYQDIDLETATRAQIIENALARSQVVNDEGELRLTVPADQVGEGLFTFIQTITHLSDIEYLKRERARSTFMEDLRATLDELLDPSVRTFDWHDEAGDPQKMYQVDCRVDGPAEPLFIFGLLNDDRCRDATITISHFELQDGEFTSLGIFEDQQQINRKVLARLTDVMERQFSALRGNEERVAQYLDEYLTA